MISNGKPYKEEIISSGLSNIHKLDDHKMICRFREPKTFMKSTVQSNNDMDLPVSGSLKFLIVSYQKKKKNMRVIESHLSLDLL